MAIDPNVPIDQEDRDAAARELARLVNDHLLDGFGDWEGYAVEVEELEMKRFVKDHWEQISRYAHLIHGS